MVNHNAVEICDDSIDNNCDGFVDDTCTINLFLVFFNGGVIKLNDLRKYMHINPIVPIKEEYKTSNGSIEFGFFTLAR